MNAFLKIKAQAMHLALLVGTVVALTLGAFVLLVYTNSFFKLKTQETIKLVNNTNKKIIAFIVANNSPTNDTIITTKTPFKTKTHQNFHGSWLKVFVKNKNPENQFSRVCFSGNLKSEKSPNLYLKNTNSPLIVVGNTKVQGNIFLPKQGVKSGTISGNYYQNPRLIYGQTFQSKDELPKLNPIWVDYINNLLSISLLQKNEANLEIPTTIDQSFKKPLKLFYRPSSIVITNEKINGNIIIKSNTSITVSASSNLKDVLLIAPIIKINSNVKGNFQAIANKQITVGKNCNLHFPSSLILVRKERDTENKTPGFFIDKGNTIQGSIVFLDKSKKTKSFTRGIQTHLKIDSNTLISGEVYCQGNIELLGTIKGACFTNRFVANQFGSKYINHLYNGKVLPFEVANYGGLPFANAKQNTFVKWLY